MTDPAKPSPLFETLTLAKPLKGSVNVTAPSAPAETEAAWPAIKASERWLGEFGSFDTAARFDATFRRAIASFDDYPAGRLILPPVVLPSAGGHLIARTCRILGFSRYGLANNTEGLGGTLIDWQGKVCAPFDMMGGYPYPLAGADEVWLKVAPPEGSKDALNDVEVIDIGGLGHGKGGVFIDWRGLGGRLKVGGSHWTSAIVRQATVNGLTGDPTDSQEVDIDVWGNQTGAADGAIFWEMGDFSTSPSGGNTCRNRRRRVVGFYRNAPGIVSESSDNNETEHSLFQYGGGTGPGVLLVDSDIGHMSRASRFKGSTSAGGYLRSKNKSIPVANIEVQVDEENLSGNPLPTDENIRVFSNFGRAGFWKVKIGPGGITAGNVDKLDVTSDQTGTSFAARFYARAASQSGSTVSFLQKQAGSTAANHWVASSSDGNVNDAIMRSTGNLALRGTVTAIGADYAECFEWADGNPNNEDRRGLSVALVGDRIRPATTGDAAHIIGVVSVNPTVLGDAADLEWNDRFLRDDYGSLLTEDYEVLVWDQVIGISRPSAMDVQAAREAGRPEPPPTLRHETVSYEVGAVPDDVDPPADAVKLTLKRSCENPTYDPTAIYTPRIERPSWAAVGLVGKLRVRKGQPTGDRWIKLRDISDTVEEWLVR